MRFWSLAKAVGKLLIPQASEPFEKSLQEMTRTLTEGLATRNNTYVFPIKYGLIGSNKVIKLPCKCGNSRLWRPPHDDAELYCEGCGSKFSLLELDGEGSYILTGEGPIRIIGADGPVLSKQERDELHHKFYDVGADLKHWTRERLLTLPKDTRLILRALAAFRKPCSVSILNSLIADLSLEKMNDALEQLKRDRLVVHDSEGYSIAEAIRNHANSIIEDSE
jgi:hypothetical protein